MHIVMNVKTLLNLILLRKTETYKGEEICFRFEIGRCKSCGSEVATDQKYNDRRSKVKIEAYKKIKEGIDILQEKYTS